ncbi:MAG: DNA polymerase IV [Verrucomicrobia bacterium]|nr:DNA polymerase IV [Verrucomicrobiota bacterium]
MKVNRRVILHLDMDAFYASVEQRDNPQLKGQPVIVGSPPTQRGVVAAASYEARKFGVRSAMPSVTAGKLCPRGVFVRPRMEAYRAESQAIMAIVRQLAGEQIQQVSVDEAYVDVSAASAAGTADVALAQTLPLARRLKATIQEQRQLTASIGIAPNKLLAKLASDFQKPDGLTLIRETEKVAFLRPLPVRSLHGVGTVTEEHLLKANLRTVGDLQDYRGDLRTLVGNWGTELKRFAFGEDDRPLDLGDDIKSISSENTFLQDTDDRPTLRQCLREQAEEIAAKLERRRLAAFTVQVKVRYGDFTTLTRQISVEEPVQEAREIYRLGCWLLGREKLVHCPLRLIGLGVSGLHEVQARQLALRLAVSQ